MPQTLNLVLPNVHDVKARLTYEMVKTINGDEILPVARIVLNVPGLEPDAVRELMHYVLAGHAVEVTLRSPQGALPLDGLRKGTLKAVAAEVHAVTLESLDDETGEVTQPRSPQEALPVMDWAWDGTLKDYPGHPVEREMGEVKSRKEAI